MTIPSLQQRCYQYIENQLAQENATSSPCPSFFTQASKLPVSLQNTLIQIIFNNLKIPLSLIRYLPHATAESVVLRRTCRYKSAYIRENITIISSYCSYIQYLDASKMIFCCNSDIRCVQALPFLRKLNIAKTNILHLTWLAGMQLEELNISKCSNIPPSEFTSLKFLGANLQKLHAACTKIDRLDERFLKNIRLLNIEGCSDLASSEFQKLSYENVPQLEILNIAGTSITSLHSLHLEKVASLNVSKCCGLEPSEFVLLSSTKVPHLTALNVSDTYIKELHTLHIRRIKKLNLSYCVYIHEDEFQKIADNKLLSCLEKLTIKALNITSLHFLYHTQLQKLTINNCYKITEEEVHKLQKQMCSSLKVLNMKNTFVTKLDLSYSLQLQTIDVSKSAIQPQEITKMRQQLPYTKIIAA